MAEYCERIGLARSVDGHAHQSIVPDLAGQVFKKSARQDFLAIRRAVLKAHEIGVGRIDLQPPYRFKKIFESDCRLMDKPALLDCECVPVLFKQGPERRETFISVRTGQYKNGGEGGA